MLRIYNSLTRDKQEFIPIQAGKVGIYVCGMTVYDYCHLGHARVMVVFDTVVRYLRAAGYEVNYIRNITDIDDKIIQRASQKQQNYAALTAFFIDAMHEDAAKLNILSPDQEPLATAHIDEIVNMITSLVVRGYAYRPHSGDVYYRVRRFDRYGELGGVVVDDLRSGARIEPGNLKEDPLDFVLWKAAKPGEPSWASPWGEGRPGWHIECSAMSTHCLGNHFDIHAGGMDLRFPHHENEIAQAEAATGEKFVNLWMHNGFVEVNNEKMSKSLGNFSTIRELLKQDVDQPRMGEILRFMILGSHYRSPLSFTVAGLAAARSALTRIYLTLDKLDSVAPVPKAMALVDPAAVEFRAAMEDDFNTPDAMAALYTMVHDCNRALDQGRRNTAMQRAALLLGLGNILGILELEPRRFLAVASASTDTVLTPSGLTRSAVDELVKEREQARLQRDWARADVLREQLNAEGIVLEDDPKGGTRWRLL
ncbi:MAG TPA: cysteine--tRNA ligase [Gammaproteobacteria bacterium]|nr:cysteine--tRNA ligase [Gammaproteobacteria bacterium]